MALDRFTVKTGDDIWGPKVVEDVYIAQTLQSTQWKVVKCAPVPHFTQTHINTTVDSMFI